MRLSVGKKKGRWKKRERKEQPRANRFKLPSTSHSRFQLETCLFPFSALRGLPCIILVARAPPECSATRRGEGIRVGKGRKRKGFVREGGGLSVNYRRVSYKPSFLLFAFFPVH